jgi:hypothetical protein
MVKTATVVVIRQKEMEDGRLDLSPPQPTARRLFGMNTATRKSNGITNTSMRDFRSAQLELYH